MNTIEYRCLFLLILSIDYLSSQYNFRVTENQPPNTIVGQVLIKSGYLYEFVHKEELFDFNTQTGIILTRKIIDRESLVTDLIEILLYKKTLEGQFLETNSIKVRIIDVNDNPPIFYPNILERRVVENIAVQTDISLTVARDADSDEFGVSNNYKIESGNEDERFMLSGVGVQYRGQLLLKVIRPLDRETRDKYNLVISVYDKGQPPMKGVLEVELIVEDYNDNSPVFSPSKYTVRLNESSLPGYEVVKVYATDADAGVNKDVEYRFKHTRSTLEYEFSIDKNSGSIRLTRQTSCHISQGDCTLVVEAFDHGSPSLSAYCYITIHVIRINSFAPRFRINYVGSAEKAAFIEMGKITKKPLAIVHCQDDDQDPRDLIAVSIIGGNDDNLFNLERAHGNVHILRQKKSMDNITLQKYVIIVRGVDSGSPSKQTTVDILIKVNKANIHPPIFQNPNQSTSISKNSSINSFVANFFATDQDPGPNGKVSYAIINSNHQEYFTIEKESGLITLSKQLWFIKTNNLKLQIAARDLGINSLETNGFLEINILQSTQLHASVQSSCPIHFVIHESQLKTSLNSVLVYDFVPKIDISDPERFVELDFIILNEEELVTDFFIAKNGSLFMVKLCRTFEIERLTFMILHKSSVLYRMGISVEITPKIANLLCSVTPTIYFIKLPSQFDYNSLLFEIPYFPAMQFNGEFEDISTDNNAYYVSQNGRIYWRAFIQNNVVVTKLEIRYFHTHKKEILSHIINVLIYPSISSDQLLINCATLDSLVNQRPDSLALENVIIGNVNNVKFTLNSNMPNRYLSIVDRNLLFQQSFYSSSSTPKDYKLAAYTDKYVQECVIKPLEGPRFERENYHFKTNHRMNGAVIGKIKILHSSSSSSSSLNRVNLTGRDHQYLLYSSQEMILSLNQSLTNDSNERILEIYLQLLVPSSTVVVSMAKVIIEVSPAVNSPIFTEPFFTFVVLENSQTHTPLQKIYLEPFLQISDYDLAIKEESFFGKWSIFSDGSLYLLSKLDYEKRQIYSFVVVASNKIDKEKMAKVVVKILVEDCNDNIPRFNSHSYFFEVNKNDKPNTTIGKVFAIDSDSGLNGFLMYEIERFPKELDFLEMDSRSGQLMTNKYIDTHKEQFNFNVLAKDYGNPSLNSSTKIFLKINPSTTTKLLFEKHTYFVNVSENMQIGQEILHLKVNSKSPIIYKITKSTHKGIFAINKLTGLICIVGPLDREKVATYALTVIAGEASEVELADNIAVANVHIRLMDINDNAPVFLDGFSDKLVLSESIKVGTILGFYQAKDLDEGLNGEVRYQLSPIGTESVSIFKIDPFSGILYLSQPLNYEYKSQWTLIIVAYDLGQPQNHKNLTLTVTVVNINDEKPKFNKDIPMEFTLQHDLEIGSTVGRIYARDLDRNEIFYYLLSVYPRNHPFTIDKISGIISISRSLSIESSFKLVVIAVDADRQDWFDEQSIKVDFKRENEAEIQMLTYGAVLLAKSAFYGDKIATLMANIVSKFSNYKLTYTLKNSSYEKLIINRYTGDVFLTVNNPVQFNTIDLTFFVTLDSLSNDPIIKYHSTKFILDHGDPHNLNFQKNEYIIEISECKALPGLQLIRLQALYPGNPISDLEYYIFDIYCGISDRIRLPNGIVVIDKESGWLNIGNKDIDREMIEGSQITVEVVVIDRGKNGSRVRTTKVFLNIIDCNDNRPIFVNETFVFHVPENTTFGQKIYLGTVHAQDSDLHSMLTFSWNSKITEFALDKSSGIITTIGIPLDYETTPFYSMEVQVSDGIFTSTANLIIIVDNINDQCHNFTSKQYSFRIRENSPIHTIIGQVSTRNSSINDISIIKYSIISEWGTQIFSVNPDHGIITTIGEIDYERDNHYILLITASDESKQSLFLPCSETVTTTVLVSIDDANDNIPVFDTGRLFVSVPENIAIDSTIYHLAASDGDKSDVMLFEIMSPNDDLFAINPITGTIFTVGRLDYEKSEKHLLTVSCSDNLHSTIVEIEVDLINVNDELPIIHNPTYINIPIIHDEHVIFIKCSDQDNLGSLSYDVLVSSTDLPFIRVDRQTGKVTINRKLFDQKPTSRLTLFCSDSLHNTLKNITVRAQQQIEDSSENINVTITVENYDKQPIKIKSFVKDLSMNSEQYAYFLSPPRHNFKIIDYKFYQINKSSGEFVSIDGFIPMQFQYRFSIIAIPLSRHRLSNKKIDISILLIYRNIDLCNPSFIGTPFSFQIDSQIVSPKFLGKITIGYCKRYKILYYLSSGHSFFYLNDTNGQLFIIRTLPLGQYRFKLSAMIDTNPKQYLSTIVTVSTNGPRKDLASCEFSILRLIIDNIQQTELSRNIGKISIRHLPPENNLVSFKLTQNRPLLSISRFGNLMLSSKLSNEENNFNLSAKVSWWDRNQFHTLHCPINLILNPPSNGCILSLVYPNKSIEILTFANKINEKRFIFGLPLAHLNCALLPYNSSFYLDDPKFTISEKTGQIFTRKVLRETVYEFNVGISSVNAMKSIYVPVKILVVDSVENVEIKFDNLLPRISLSWKAPNKSIVTSVKANVIPSTFQPLIRYKIVYFCCIYPSNIAIFNSSIYQSFFSAIDESGDIVLSSPLPKMNTEFTVRIRASIETQNPRKAFYRDNDINISVYDNECKCNYQGQFSGTIEENSDSEVVVARNILQCHGNRKVSFALFPQSYQEFLYYNTLNNEIRTGNKPIDREMYDHLEIEVTISDTFGNIIETCPGIVKVIDLNDNSPTFTLNYFMGFISEDALIGTWIIDIGVIDRDSKIFPLKFSIQGEDSGRFFINSQNGSVFLAQTVNREQKQKYELKVAVSDGRNVLEIGMLITVLDANDNYPQISKEIINRTFVINTSEFVLNNVVVTNITATDEDDPQSNNSKIRYSLSSNNQKIPIESLIFIDENTGTLSISSDMLNWVSENETVDIVVIATDKGQPPLSSSANLHIIFINEVYELKILNAPYQDPIAVLHTSSEGSKIMNIAVDHKDLYSNISFRIINGNGSAYFAMDSRNGQINTNRNINSAVIDTWFTLIVQACAYRNHLTLLFCSKKETIFLVVSDLNLYTPQIRTSQTTISISETTKVGTSLLMIDVIDQDSGLSGMIKIAIGQPFNQQFSLISSTSSSFASASSSSMSSNGKSFQLTVLNPLDYETQQQYSLTLLVHDLGFPRRSQTAIIIINIIDEDDNAPYFASRNFVYFLPNIDHIIKLPPIIDEDSFNANTNSPTYSLKTTSQTSVNLFQINGNLSLKVIKPSVNESVVLLSLYISGVSIENYPKKLPIGRFSVLMIYLVLPLTKTSFLECSFTETKFGNQIIYVPLTNHDNQLNGIAKSVYHFLTSYPTLSKQYISVRQNTGYIHMPNNLRVSSIFIAISNSHSSSHQYQICHLSRSSFSSIKIKSNDIKIDKNLKSEQIIGKVEVFSNSHIFTKGIKLRLYSSHYLPFSIKDSGEMFNIGNIYSNYPAVYTVLIKAISRVNESDCAFSKILINVQINKSRNPGISVSLKIRENIGDGAILGSLETILRDHSIGKGAFSLGKEYFDSRGYFVIDKKGVIRIQKPIDKESIADSKIIVIIDYVDQSDVLSLLIKINDENDSESKSRDADIVLGISEYPYQLTRIAQLLPLDKDSTGDYQCRLASPNVPLGILITPDCWLHIVNSSSALRWSNNSYVQVIHHDGYHKAVISTFRMKIAPVKYRKIQNNWIILKLSKSFSSIIIRNLKSVRSLLLSLRISTLLMGIEPLKNYLVIWPSSANRNVIVEKISQHKHEIEALLQVKIVEIITELCNEKYCNFHGGCSTELVVNYQQLYTDEQGTTQTEIYVYPTINIHTKCLCNYGYVGETCSLMAKCRLQICHNGGICGITVNSESVCECPQGYTGYNCEYDVNECDRGELCDQHGSCNNIQGTFKCECQLNWSGNSFCTQPLNHCVSNPCSEHGTEQCIPLLGGFMCRCHFGHYGDRCQHSAISFPEQSYLEMEFKTISKLSFEFSTILNDTPFVTIIMSPSIIIQISLSFGCIRISIYEDLALISQRDSKKELSTGKWWKLDLFIHRNNILVSILACSEWNECEFTNDMFRTNQQKYDISLSSGATVVDFYSNLKVLIGSNLKVKLSGVQYFVGCIRNIQLNNATIVRNEGKNLLYDSCPRYKSGSLPCSHSEQKCGGVGKCIDEWFVGRCLCPSGYQPPLCSPGYSAFSISPNTIISYSRRPKPAASHQIDNNIKNKFYYQREKRATSQDHSMISIRIKTKDSNCIIFIAFSSFHSYTLVQLENGLVKVVDKYAGSSKEMLHKVVPVNDNRIHTITVTRHSTGTVSVTVDFVVAQVNWLQSHDIIGKSVNEVYLAGLPESKKIENSIDLPNFTGCMSDIRFNNETMPLDGLTESFNVSVIQGSLAVGCPSDICRQSGVCEKYQRCQEIFGVPHAMWGQYKCVDDNKYRLLSILLPVLVGVLIFVILTVLLVVLIRQRSKRTKAKKSVDQLNSGILLRKNKTKTKHVTHDEDKFIGKKRNKTPRSETSSTLLMQDIDKGTNVHPDLLRSHDLVVTDPDWSKNKRPNYYQVSTMANTYLSSGNITFDNNYLSKQTKHFPRSVDPSNEKLQFTYSTGTLKMNDDSQIYQCSRPDVYDAVGSPLSSNNSQDQLDQPRFPFAHQFQTQGFKYDFHIIQKQRGADARRSNQRPFDIRQSSSSSSNNSHLIHTKMPTSSRRNLFPDKRKPDDIFSNTESNFTSSPHKEISLESLSSSSSSTNSQNAFTSTNSSESFQSKENNAILNSSNCWANNQRVRLPSPPPEDQYEYADIKTN